MIYAKDAKELAIKNMDDSKTTRLNEVLDDIDSKIKEAAGNGEFELVYAMTEQDFDDFSVVVSRTLTNHRYSNTFVGNDCISISWG